MSLGPDCDAIEPDDRGESFFDFGLGRFAGRFGIRTGDDGLAARLRGCEGLEWPAPLGAVGADLARVSPTRVVRNPIGRIEVFTPIPPPGGVSPPGPHTQFLPELLAIGGDLPPTLTIPDSLTACAVHHRKRPQ